MTPHVSLVGKSNSGKTTLLEKLVRELKSRGLRVGTIKHDLHDFDIDRPGKDSWRHAQAGADTVVISSPRRAAAIQRLQREYPLAELVARFFDDVDLVVTEGYKRESTCRVEVHRAARGPELVCRAEELLAVATDEPLALEVPQFDLNDAAGLADFLVERLVKGGTGMSGQTGPTVELQAEGRSLRAGRFVTKAIAGTLRGMIASLRDVPEPRQVRVIVARDPEPQTSLEVNGEPIELNRFATAFFCATILGMVQPLEGGQDATRVEIAITYP